MRQRCLLFIINIFISTIVLSQSVVPYPDNSPDVESFIAFGMSSPYERWDSKAYAEAIELLNLIYDEDKYALPRMESEYSGAIFRRLISIENLSFLLDTDMPTAFKMVKLEEFRDVDMQLLMLYIENAEKEERFGTEVLECLYFMIFKANTSLNLYAKYAEEVEEEISLNPRFEKGMKEIRNDLLLKIQLVLDIVQEDFYKYRKVDMMTFANKLYFLLPEIKDEKIKYFTQKSVSNMAMSHPNERMKAIFEDMKNNF